MKQVMIAFLVLVFTSGFALAQAAKTHEVAGVVVKTDATAKTIDLARGGSSSHPMPRASRWGQGDE